MPDFSTAVSHLDNRAMLELAEPLGLDDGLKIMLNQVPEPADLSAELWQQGIADWQPVSRVLPIVMSLLRACDRVDALERKGVLKIDIPLVRGLAVTACAPFAPDGEELLSQLAELLGGRATEPAELLDRYMASAEAGDADTLAGIDRCIMENSSWRQWSDRFLATGKAFPFIPRVIGVCPPLSSGLRQALANTVMEVLDAERSRDYSN